MVCGRSSYYIFSHHIHAAFHCRHDELRRYARVRESDATTHAPDLATVGAAEFSHTIISAPGAAPEWI
jgi:hypothetical protein